jgi:hypothetical protein
MLYVYMHVASEEMILLQFTTMGIIGRLLKSAMHLQAGASNASTASSCDGPTCFVPELGAAVAALLTI